MASWTGLLNNPASMTPIQMSMGPNPSNLVSPTLVPQFKMTGYYVTGSVYETWTSYDYTNTTPPSGHTLTNVTYVRLA